MKKFLKAETITTALLVASVAVLVIYFVWLAVANFNLDLFIKSLI